ncbi:MAG TPA: ABC transporter permease subunit [Anaerolineae bacterium]|nr:ABC transporter permease subunit [Anaerolineae bacterium]
MAAGAPRAARGVALGTMVKGDIFRRLLLGVGVVLVLLPMVPLLLWSVAQGWFFPALLPAEWSWRAWEYVLSERAGVFEALGYSGLVAMVVTLFSLLIGVPAGRALGLYQFRGKVIVYFLILAPVMMPVIAVAMGIHVAFLRWGLADRLLGVVLVHLVPVLPYVVLVLSSVFANYEVAYEAQARTLGARPWQVWWHVVLPMIWPGLVVAGLFAFIISWSQYLLTLLIGGGQVVTLPVLLFAFANSGDKAITAALSLIFIAPVLLLFGLTSRYLTGRNAALGGLGRV